MMAIKGAKTIAEYAIRRWLQEQNFDLSCFDLQMDKNTALLTDKNGDSITLEYNGAMKEVSITG